VARHHCWLEGNIRMKLIIAGGRDFVDATRIATEIDALNQQGLIPDDLELVCGMARGADITAFNIFHAAGLPIHQFKPDWSIGKSAGFIRNAEMAKFADAAVCFWDQKSKGTKHMIETMLRLRKQVWVFTY